MIILIYNGMISITFLLSIYHLFASRFSIYGKLYVRLVSWYRHEKDVSL
jgi:hypothetical protein